MVRPNLTELVLIIETNHPLLRDPSHLQDIIKHQAARPPFKITLHTFDDTISHHAIDFKNIRDIDLSPIGSNTGDNTNTPILHTAIMDTLKVIIHRHQHICSCRLPENTIILIYTTTTTTAPVTLPEQPFHNYLISPSPLDIHPCTHIPYKTYSPDTINNIINDIRNTSIPILHDLVTPAPQNKKTNTLPPP